MTLHIFIPRNTSGGYDDGYNGTASNVRHLTSWQHNHAQISAFPTNKIVVQHMWPGNVRTLAASSVTQRFQSIPYFTVLVQSELRTTIPDCLPYSSRAEPGAELRPVVSLTDVTHCIRATVLVALQRSRAEHRGDITFETNNCAYGYFISSSRFCIHA